MTECSPSGWDSLRSDEWVYSWRITGQDAPPEGWVAYVITADETPRVFWRSIERGLARARGFTWDECARRHDEAYEELGAN